MQFDLGGRLLKHTEGLQRLPKIDSDIYVKA